MDEIIYPTIEEIEYYNTIAIELFRKSKPDQAKTIEQSYISQALKKMQQHSGDLYDKAAVLLNELTYIHAFESGNKRTAFLSTKQFILKNEGKFNIYDTTDNARVMIGIREKYYAQEELREWIEHGTIRTFQR